MEVDVVENFNSSEESVSEIHVGNFKFSAIGLSEKLFVCDENSLWGICDFR